MNFLISKPWASLPPSLPPSRTMMSSFLDILLTSHSSLTPSSSSSLHTHTHTGKHQYGDSLKAASWGEIPRNCSRSLSQTVSHAAGSCPWPSYLSSWKGLKLLIPPVWGFRGWYSLRGASSSLRGKEKTNWTRKSGTSQKCGSLNVLVANYAEQLPVSTKPHAI